MIDHNKPIRLLILDDHRVFTEALSMMFEGDPNIRVVAIAHTSQEALSKLDQHPVDVAVVDIRLTDSKMDGLETAAHLYEHFPRIRVLLLTTHLEGKIVAQALEQQVAGYLVKNAAGSELRRAIMQVYEGGTYYSPAIMKAHMDYTRSLHEEGPPIRLTKRERQILTLLVQEYSTAEIGNLLKIGDAGVETHRRNLRQKLDVKNTAGLVREALRRNLVELD